MATRRRQWTQGGVALGALALAWVAASVLIASGLRGPRLDLTANDLYTLSPGTVALARGLDEPVNLYFYFSREAAQAEPQLRTYGTRVRELLEEIAAASAGKVRLEVIDPQPFSEDEDRAAEFGLQPAPLGPGGSSFYFGLAGTNSTDGRAVIEFFQPAKERLLEYDIARLIQELGRIDKPVVGLLTRLPMTFGYDPASQRMREPWVIVSQLQQSFELRNIEPQANAIPDDVDVLMLVHPKNLSDDTLFAIDQFVLRGGRLFAFIDPSAEQDLAGGNPMDPFGGDGRASDLGPLLDAWGVRFDPGQVIGDDEFALAVSSGAQPVRHLGFLGMRGDALAPDDPATAVLDLVNFATAGFLRPVDGASSTFQPLVTSSARAAPIAAARFAMAGDPSTLYEGFEPTGERYVLAARVSGRFKTAFPERAAGPDAATALSESAEVANLVIVADTDVLADMLWTRAQSFLGQRFVEAWANNGDLVFNTLDNLTGSPELISIRGRASFVRPFDRVDALRRSADERLRSTESELERRLDETEQRLVELQSRREDQSSLILTPEQEAELERFRDERTRIRKELRDVRLDLDREIEALGKRLKLANILLLPGVLMLLVLVAVRLRRRYG